VRAAVSRQPGTGISIAVIRALHLAARQIHLRHILAPNWNRPMPIAVYYLFIKIVFFFSLVRAQIRTDLLKEHFLFLSVLYTAAVAFLSYMFFVSWQGQDNFPSRMWELQLSKSLGLTPWQVWLGETLLLSALYFKLMARFDEGVLFWTLLLLGMPVALF
jgi:hypothetical protein